MIADASPVLASDAVLTLRGILRRIETELTPMLTNDQSFRAEIAIDISSGQPRIDFHLGIRRGVRALEEGYERTARR